MTLDKGISVSPEVSKHREGLRPFAYEDEDESGMSGHRGRVATDQSNKFVGIICRVLLSKRDPSVYQYVIGISRYLSTAILGKNVYTENCF